jgi:hypothetical protein
MNSDFADDVVSAVAVKADEVGYGGLSEHERNVLVPWWAYGIICNGGFKFFFEGRYDLARYDLGALARRFRVLGLEDAAVACEHVVAALFGGAQPADPARWKAMVAGVEWSLVAPHEKKIYSVSWDRLLVAIGGYLERYRQQFKEAFDLAMARRQAADGPDRK